MSRLNLRNLFSIDNLRKKLIISSLLIMAFVALIIGLLAAYVRSEKFNQFVISQIKASAPLYGLRVEIEGFGFSLNPSQAKLKNLKVFNKKTDELLLETEQTELNLEIIDLYALKLKRKVILKELNLKGLKLFLEFSPNGRNSLIGIDAPNKNDSSSSSTIEIDSSVLQITITDSSLSLKDNINSIDLKLDKLGIDARLKTTTQVEVKVKAEGGLSYKDYNAKIDSILIDGIFSDQGLELQPSFFVTNLGKIELKGELKDWKKLEHKLEIQGQTENLDVADLKIKGQSAFQGKIVGDKNSSCLSGNLSVADLKVAESHLVGLEVVNLELITGTRFDLATQKIKLESINVNPINAKNIEIPTLKGSFSNNSFEFVLPKLSTSSMTAPKSQISGIELKDINLKLLDKNLETSVKQALIANVVVPNTKVNSIKLAQLTAQITGSNYNIKSDLAISQAIFNNIQADEINSKLFLENNILTLSKLRTNLLGGQASLDAEIALSGKSISRLQTNFEQINSAELGKLFQKEPLPITGLIKGNSELTWPGIDFLQASGELKANIQGQTTDTDKLPLTAQLIAQAQTGKINIKPLTAKLGSTDIFLQAMVFPKTKTITADYQVKSTSSQELFLLAKNLKLLDQKILDYKAELSGNLIVKGQLNGTFDKLLINNAFQASNVGFQGNKFQNLVGKLELTPEDIKLDISNLLDIQGGMLKATYQGKANDLVNTGNLKADFQDFYLELYQQPENKELFVGKINGSAEITNLSENGEARAQLKLNNVKVGGQLVDSAQVELFLINQLAELTISSLELASAKINGKGTLSLKTKDFSFQGQVKDLELAKLTTDSALAGIVNSNLQINGNINDLNNLQLSLQAESKNLQTPTTELGQLSLIAKSDNQGRIRTEIISYLIPTKPQKILAIISTNKTGYPIEIESELSELDIALLMAAFKVDTKGMVNSKLSAKIAIKGNILNNKDEFSLDNFQGNILLTSANVKLSDQLLNIETPCNITLEQGKLCLERIRVFSDSSDITLNGQLALTGNNTLELATNGAINLAQFSSLIPNSSLTGVVKIDSKLTGTVNKPNLSGNLMLSNLAFSRQDLPIEFRNGNGLIKLNNDKIFLDNFSIRANDGEVTSSGQVNLKGFDIANLQLKLDAKDINLIYQSVAMTLKADVLLEGTPADAVVKGNVKVLEAIYSKPFDTSLLNSSVSIDDGTKSLFSPRLDINIDANESIIVRNPQIDTVASASISLGGQLTNPNLTGRISLEGGTVTLRKQRYDITQGFLDLPGGILVPTIDLLAEGEVSTYRVFIRFTGPIDQIDLDLESEPNLTRTEILALITTGRTELGGGENQDLTTTGLNTGANLIAQEFISKPFGRKAEQFLGLNQFQVDPVIRPNENPSARLTLGREIIPKLSFTYSTSLSSSKDQTIALEYKLSNRFSSLFTFTQGGGTSTKGNTKDSDYTFEIRGRERFSLSGKGNLEKNATLSTMTSFKPLSFPNAEVIIDKPDDIKISSDTLRDLLPIKRQTFSSPLARLGQENLTNYLQEKGYFFAKVTTSCEPFDCQGSDLKVHYKIEPGTRYEVRQISITGTNLISPVSVISQLQSKQKSFVGKFPILGSLPFVGGLADGITSNERLRQDSDLIRQQVIDLGYRQATVSYNYNVDSDGRGLRINFSVQEGAISRISQIDLLGVNSLSKEELRQEIPINLGDPFIPSRPREVAQKLVDYYAQQGYLDAKIDLEIEQMPNNNVKLIYQINEGSIATVGNIAFIGTAGINEKALSRFIELKLGDVITNRKLQQLQKDLYATGNFREIQILTIPGIGLNPTDRQVLIKLTEAKPLLLVYGFGFSSDDGPRGSLELSNTDILNRINSASLRLRLGKREQTVQLQFTDQRPFGSRWSTTISTLYSRLTELSANNQQISNVDQTNLNNTTNIGLNRFLTFVQTERRLTNQTLIRFRYNFEINKLTNLDDTQSNAFAETSRITRIATLSIGAAYDKRDNPINPTKGQFLSLDYSIASRILGGNESFNKISTNYQYYAKTKDSFPIPFINRSTIAFSSRIGLAAPFEIRSRRGDGIIRDSDRLLPFSERFRSGGATTLRGFEFEQAGPQAITEVGNNAARLIPLGGDALVVFNLELRYPISRRLQLVPFYDLGNVFSRVKDISFRKMTNTLGLGLRFNTPIGPIGVDYGYLLDPQSFTTPNGGILRQRQGVIHIKFGQSF
ncbi:MAG: translocation/assembly module TamB domain-containing protein [Acidobacteria bacterium]|nr:translocation/assembly module TamB domain-containing protein [Acidobacteriota bacterium]